MVSISSRGIFGRSLSRKVCFARGKPEELNGARTAQPAVTDQTKNGVSERVSERVRKSPPHNISSIG